MTHVPIIGIIGGGQLARMMAEAASPLQAVSYPPAAEPAASASFDPYDGYDPVRDEVPVHPQPKQPVIETRRQRRASSR